MDSIVSIIVPVYNAVLYLDRCIESIMNQSYKNFELILIDDGSTDSSGTICDNYAKCDNRIKVYHKSNGGPSSSRNLGIEMSSSEWIIFVDADDYISPDYLESFFKYGELNLYSQIIQGFYVFDEKGIVDNTNKSLTYTKYIYTNIESKKYSPAIEEYRLLQRTEVWGKLFSSSLIKNNGIKFDERITIYEDGIFWYTYLLYVKKIVLIPEQGYYYYYPTTSNSLMHTHKFTIDERLSILEHTSVLQPKLIIHFALKGDYAKEVYGMFLNGYRKIYINDSLTYVQFKRLKSIKPKNIKYVRNLKDIFFLIINQIPLKWYLIASRHLIR